jgi:glycosyltransferase involved in cell wall biosynthesis
VSEAPIKPCERLVLASESVESARYRFRPLHEAGLVQLEEHLVASSPRPHETTSIEAAGARDTVLVLQRVLPTVDELRRFRALYRAIIFDIDDALYAVPPVVAGARTVEYAKQAARLVVRGSRTASSRRSPLIRTMKEVDVVVVGNEVLGDFASRHAARVTEIPTTVSCIATRPKTVVQPRPIVVWMGLPDNMQHLELVRRPLERLARSLDFTIRIISGRPWPNAPVRTEFIPWEEGTYRDLLLSSTIGVAPLANGPWTRGKCALRSIQYGAHGLPTVASPVGVTDQVVLHGTTGYLAAGDNDWTDALGALLKEPAIVEAMGQSALNHIRNAYSDGVALRHWSAVLASL